MTTTSLYRLGQNPQEIGETRNAWRGGMYVWNDIAKRYFGLVSFPMFDRTEQNKVWNAYDHVSMPMHEIIVLLTTMDNATVRAEDIGPVAAAFEQYGREHPDSSISEQAAILRATTFEPGDVVGWLQTSVSEFWGQSWDEETEVWYDPKTGTKHFDVYSDATTAYAARNPTKPEN